MKPPMRVMVFGFRGFPGVQGGIETHAEHLYPLLVEKGCRVDVVVRTCYMEGECHHLWKGVRLHRLWAPGPRFKGIEAFLHSLLSLLAAAMLRPDVVHIHAIGPAIMAPLGKLLGLRIVVTHHGPDYEREKWGRAARFVLKLGERLGMRFADRRITISRVIQERVQLEYGMGSELIPNGVIIPEMPKTQSTLRRFGLEAGRYVLMVSRLVPEKRHLDLIEAFCRAGLTGWRLALVGGLEPGDDYVHSVARAAGGNDHVVLTGYQSGPALQELYAHAGVFVLPSSHEGLPIVLLEALSYGLPVLASDIPAHLELGLSARHYYPLGDMDAMVTGLAALAAQRPSRSQREEIRAWVTERYDWQKIAGRTLAVYRQAVLNERDCSWDS
jgi:glycosyltransferase involved in cell wall biosynthesis